MDPAAAAPGEECHSNESGWTYYLCSPMNEDYDDGYGHHQDDDDDDDDDDGDGDSDGYDDHHHMHAGKRYDHNSDDSMASDASTGPRHHHPNPTVGNRRNEDEVASRRRDNYSGTGSSSKRAKGQIWEEPVKNDETVRFGKEEKGKTVSSAPPPPHRAFNKAGKDLHRSKRYSI